MSDGPTLAVSGSNVTGDVPFSCALRLPFGIFEARSPAGARGDLAALVAGLCAAHAVRAEQIAEIRLDLGPGSYTGLRVVVTFVRFLQRFSAVTVRAIDSLALLAAAARPLPAAGRRIRPLLDARRNRYHTGLWTPQGGRLVATAPARAVALHEVLEDTHAGDFVVVPAAVEAQVGAQLRALGAELQVVSGVAAAALFADELPFTVHTGEELEPRYLMPSYAEQ